MADGPVVEIELSGVGAGWTDITTDVSALAPIRPSYGIAGSGPNDRVAGTGTLTFSLRNENPTTAAKGYYSPESANVRTGFALGVRVRFSYLIGATTYRKFIGRLKSIRPTAGKNIQPQLVECEVVDWMEEAARHRLASLATQTNKRADELLTSVAAAVPTQPISTTFDTGSETYVLALDETVEAISEIGKITFSEFGFCYIRGNTSSGGNLRFESRTARLPVGTVSGTFTDSEIASLSMSYDADQLVNLVDATTHPRTQDSSTTSLLFELQGTPLVTAGQTIKINGEYTDPTQRAVRVSGMDMVNPAATTHYTMNTVSTGGGTDLTANFTVSAAYTGSVVFYTITNNSTQDGYITKLNALGRGLYDFEPIGNRASDTGSIDDQGERYLNIDMPYQSDAAVGKSVAEFVLRHYSDLGGSAECRVGIRATTTALTDQVIAREPGDQITITETMTGLDHNFYINSVDLSIVKGEPALAEWGLFRAEPRGYWNLEVIGYGELDLTTYLAPL